MSENVDGMQTMLNIFSEYCNTWQLQVNIAKTNVVIFSKSKVTLTEQNSIFNLLDDISLFQKVNFRHFISITLQAIIKWRRLKYQQSLIENKCGYIFKK
jgi:hypothetical protein